MRIQLLHGQVIPPGIPLRGEMPACQKENSSVGMGTDFIPISVLCLQHHWQKHPEGRTTCHSRTGYTGDGGKRKDSSAVRFGKKKNKPTNQQQEPTQNQTPKEAPKQTERPEKPKVTEVLGKSGQRDTQWGHPCSFSSSARDHFITRFQGSPV